MIWSAAEPSFSAPAYGGYQSWLGEAFPKWGKRLALVGITFICITANTITLEQSKNG